MVWKKDGDKNDDNRKGPKKGEGNNPWGAGNTPEEGPGEGSGENTGPVRRTPPSAGSPNSSNPWGGNDPEKGPGERPRTGTPDFDEFIRRSQARLRAFGGGRNGNTPPSGNSGDNSGGGRSFHFERLPLGPIAAIAILIFLGMSSAYRVEAGNRAIITRFGKYVDTTGPGFHFKLPAPISHVQKISFDDIRTTQIGNPEGDQENLMITGDQNIINIVYQVRWRLKDAADFAFEIADKEATVRDATESAMRDRIGRSTLTNAIGPERATIAQSVAERVQDILDSYHAGVFIEGVDINKADPPAAVDDAFKDVSAAQQDVEQYMNQAQAYAAQITAKAEGDTAAFNKVYDQYKLAPVVTRKRMYLDTMQDVLSRVDKTVIDAKGVQTYLPLREIDRNRGATAEKGAK